MSVPCSWRSCCTSSGIHLRSEMTSADGIVNCSITVSRSEIWTWIVLEKSANVDVVVYSIDTAAGWKSAACCNRSLPTVCVSRGHQGRFTSSMSSCESRPWKALMIKSWMGLAAERNHHLCSSSRCRVCWLSCQSRRGKTRSSRKGRKRIRQSAGSLS